MRRLMLLTAGVALAAVPAVFGLTDNPSFSHSVSVRIPAGAVRVTGGQTGDVGQLRHTGGHGSGVDGHGTGDGASATPDRSGKDHGAASKPDRSGKGQGAAAKPDVSGKDRGAAPRPDVSGKDRGAAPRPDVSGKDRGAAPRPDVSGKGHGAAPTPKLSGKDGQGDATTPNVPSVSPPPGKRHAPAVIPDQARVSPAALDERARPPEEPGTGGGRGNSQDVGDGMSRGGGSGEKLPF